MSAEQRAAATRLALVKARAGVPAEAISVDPDVLDAFLAEYSTTVVGKMPRAVRRAGQDIVFDGVQMGLRWAFWLGAAYVVQQDRET